MRLLRWPLGFCPSLTYVFFTHPSELISLKTNLSHVPAKNCSVVSPYMENTTPSPFLRPPSLSLAATSHLLPGLHGPTPPTFLQALAHSEQLPISGPLPVLFHLHGTLFPFLSQLESYPYFLFWRCVYWSGTWSIMQTQAGVWGRRRQQSVAILIMTLFNLLIFFNHGIFTFIFIF